MSDQPSSRRQFLSNQLLGLFGLLFLGCRQLTQPETGTRVQRKSNIADLIMPGTVAHFLQDKFPIYDDQTDWEFPGGEAALLLQRLGEHPIGNYHYYVNGVLIIGPINRAALDPAKQTLIIKRNGQTIYGHAPTPRRRPQQRD